MNNYGLSPTTSTPSSEANSPVSRIQRIAARALSVFPECSLSWSLVVEWCKEHLLLQRRWSQEALGFYVSRDVDYFEAFFADDVEQEGLPGLRRLGTPAIDLERKAGVVPHDSGAEVAAEEQERAKAHEKRASRAADIRHRCGGRYWGCLDDVDGVEVKVADAVGAGGVGETEGGVGARGSESEGVEEVAGAGWREEGLAQDRKTEVLSTAGPAYRKGEVVGRSGRCGDGLLEPAAVRWVAAVECEMMDPFGGVEAVVGAEDEAGVAAVAGRKPGPSVQGEGAGDVLSGSDAGEFEGSVDDGKRGHGLREGGDEDEVTHSGDRCERAGVSAQWLRIPKVGRNGL